MKEYFDSRSFLFLGYSLDDWNLRVILHSLKGILKRNAAPADGSSGEDDFAKTFGVTPARTHWSIQKDPTEYDQAVWRGRNVTIGNRDLNVFVDSLLSQLKEDDTQAVQA